mgnify:CR=1 FL=1
MNVFTSDMNATETARAYCDKHVPSMSRTSLMTIIIHCFINWQRERR